MIGLCCAVGSLLLTLGAAAPYGNVETYEDHRAHMKHAEVLGMKIVNR